MNEIYSVKAVETPAQIQEAIVTVQEQYKIGCKALIDLNITKSKLCEELTLMETLAARNGFDLERSRPTELVNVIVIDDSTIEKVRAGQQTLLNEPRIRILSVVNFGLQTGIYYVDAG